MNINWKIRLQNGWFWAGIVSIIGMIVLYFNPSFDWEPVKDILMAVLTLLAGVGIISDPTTKGAGDSEATKVKTDINDVADQVVKSDGTKVYLGEADQAQTVEEQTAWQPETAEEDKEAEDAAAEKGAE